MLLQLEHARVQLVVASPLVDELLMGAPLDDAALLQLVHAPLDEGFGRVTFYEAGIWWICFFLYTNC